MDWALNDPDHGAYGSGQLRIGPHGDFVTSPSLGSDFSQLLAVQVGEWLMQIDSSEGSENPLTLIDIGPGEGTLVADLIPALFTRHPSLRKRLEVILVEKNLPMVERQKRTLDSLAPLKVQWLSLDEIASQPVMGVIIAHEVLDAMPVERLVLRKQNVYRQGVALNHSDPGPYLIYEDLPITSELTQSIQQARAHLGLIFPPKGAQDGWNTEWHVELKPWFQQSASALIKGKLLVIDYALEAARYYKSSRANGTLMAYCNQKASSDALSQPGLWDLTAHLCIETLIDQACTNGWRFLGEVRQGQALLALGLARRINALQRMPPDQIQQAFKRREALLRLIDPTCLGEFRWIAFERDQGRLNTDKTSFLEEPSDAKEQDKI